ncbi:MAG: hypothetical protein LC792_00415 [Actinobacteria bacterium]|nr:hypothetical protein [Actinomycetota bacterium]
MLHIEKVTAAWSEWMARTPPEVLASVTHVQLNNEGHGGYDVHLSAYDADQDVADRLAAALGCPSNLGWEPPQPSRSARQWSLNMVRDGLDWHATVVREASVEAEQTT